jgi:hypothetical protein
VMYVVWASFIAFDASKSINGSDHRNFDLSNDQLSWYWPSSRRYRHVSCHYDFHTIRSLIWNAVRSNASPPLITRILKDGKTLQYIRRLVRLMPNLPPGILYFVLIFRELLRSRKGIDTNIDIVASMANIIMIAVGSVCPASYVCIQI